MERVTTIDVRTPAGQQLKDMSFAVNHSLALVSIGDTTFLERGQPIWAMPPLRQAGTRTAAMPNEALIVWNCVSNEVFGLDSAIISGFKAITYRAKKNSVSDLIAIQSYEIDDEIIQLFLASLAISNDMGELALFLGVGVNDIKLTNSTFVAKNFKTDDLLRGDTIWFG